MFINTIEIMRRKNLGNYEHFEVKLGASLTENDDFDTAYNKVMGSLSVALEGKPLATAKKVNDEVKTKEVIDEPKIEKKAKKKATKKKVTKEVKEVEVVNPLTVEEMMVLCRETAGRLNSGDKVKALIIEVCGVPSLKAADAKTFTELAKKLVAA